MTETFVLALVPISALLFSLTDVALLALAALKLRGIGNWQIQAACLVNASLMAFFLSLVTAATHLTGVMLREWMVASLGISAIETGTIGALASHSWLWRTPSLTAALGLYDLWYWYFLVKPHAP